MIAVQVSTFIAHRLYGDSLFDLALNDRGFKIGLGRQHIQMNDIPIKDILSNDALTFNENETIKIVDSKMSESEVTEAVIINDIICTSWALGGPQERQR